MQIKLYDLIFDKIGNDKQGTQLFILSPQTKDYELYSIQAKAMKKPLSYWKRFFLKHIDPRDRYTTTQLKEMEIIKQNKKDGEDNRS